MRALFWLGVILTGLCLGMSLAEFHAHEWTWAVGDLAAAVGAAGASLTLYEKAYP